MAYIPSDNIEGVLLKQQVQRLYKQSGTVDSLLVFPKKTSTQEKRWPSTIKMMEECLADIGWSIDTDVAHWGAEERREQPQQEPGSGM